MVDWNGDQMTDYGRDVPKNTSSENKTDKKLQTSLS